MKEELKKQEKAVALFRQVEDLASLDFPDGMIQLLPRKQSAYLFCTDGSYSDDWQSEMSVHKDLLFMAKQRKMQGFDMFNDGLT
jgi:hypothetical protein